MIPKNPQILLSFVNTKLRDQYSSLDDLCDDLDLVKDDIEKVMEDICYQYNSNENQFKPKGE